MYLLQYNNGEFYEDFREYILCYVLPSEIDQAKAFIEQNKVNGTKLSEWVARRNELLAKYVPPAIPEPIRPIPPSQRMTYSQQQAHKVAKDKRLLEHRKVADELFKHRSDFQARIEDSLGPSPNYYNNLELIEVPGFSSIISQQS